MFKNVDTFLANNGLFIGTTMNGDKVRKLLGKNDIVERFDKDSGVLYYSIEKIKESGSKSKSKKCSKKDKSGLGEAVNVYIRTINTLNEEYLVDFDILDNEMSKYAIYPASKPTL